MDKSVLKSINRLSLLCWFATWLCHAHLRGWILDFLISFNFDAKIHYNKLMIALLKISETKGTARASTRWNLVWRPYLRVASLRYIEGCYLPIIGISWLFLPDWSSTCTSKDKIHDVFKPYNVVNNALWG